MASKGVKMVPAYCEINLLPIYPGTLYPNERIRTFNGMFNPEMGNTGPSENVQEKPLYEANITEP